MNRPIIALALVGVAFVAFAIGYDTRHRYSPGSAGTQLIPTAGIGLPLSFDSSSTPITTARSSELWSCNVTSMIDQQPMLVTFEVHDKELIQTWATGMTFYYEIVQDNVYGLVALSSISQIESGQTKPTIGASAIVIGRMTKEVWISALVIGFRPEMNEPAHGPCIRN